MRTGFACDSIMISSPKVYLVEDDEAVRDSIVWMLSQNSVEVEAYNRPSDLIQEFRPDMRGCLVVDLRLPETDGLELCRILREMGAHLPFIVITGHGEIRDATEAMRRGAIDFIEKPLDQTVFLNRIRQAVELDQVHCKTREGMREFQERLDSLTARRKSSFG